MTASGKKLLESKDSIEDIMPCESWGLPESVVNVVMEYAIDVPFLKPGLFFSGSNQALLKVLFLAEHAGPLDKFEFFLRRHITEKSNNDAIINKIYIMDDFQGTLIQLLISRLDVSIRKEKRDNMKENEGMAERFIKIITELLPDRLNEVQQQAESASIQEGVVKKQMMKK